MTRTVAREIAIQIGFGVVQSGAEPSLALDEFFDIEYFSTLSDEDELFREYPDEAQLEYIKKVVIGTVEHKSELEEYIEKYSKGWKLSRISRIAAAILRTALFEVLYMDDIPDSVAINEAVELAKGYEEPETIAFINGILGSFMRAEREGAPPEDIEE
jgi:N utilization substance protein B